MKKRIKQLATLYFEQIVEIRRHLHEYPELSKQEFKTAEFISAQLRELNINFEGNIGGVGIVAKIEGKNPQKRCVALRADIDALPIEEFTSHTFKSKNTGIMHACGHDVHTASLLGTARILSELRQDFEGTVMLIFQPSEEQAPGGASLMLEQGIFDKVLPNAIFAFHVLPEMPVGCAGFRQGKYMASADEIHITVTGKGGHAAMPHLLIDPVLIASHIVVALQQVVSRNAMPLIPSILSFGKFEAKGQTNVIPNTVTLAGTFRTFDEDWRFSAHKKIISIAKGIAQSMGGDCEVFIAKGYPAIINDSNQTALAKQCAAEFLGTENVTDLDLRTTADDFGFFAQKVPACYFRLGIHNPNHQITNLHTPHFDVDEKVLAHSTGIMAWIAYNALMKE